ncbi:HAMP domain-containing protein [Spirosoma telluris]|uniref:HAMP domain-containing protein n=1 Tax=Spirosoma telluris TaxID=2183553 RepID=UPI0038CD5A03
MDELRIAVSQMKAEEENLLSTRIEQQQIYIKYTPFLLVIAAIVSMLITALTYFRIKRDLDDRIARQKLDEAKYIETAGRIAVMEDITQEIAGGDYSVRSTDTKDDELGRIAKALNQMASSLEQTFTDLNNKNWLQAGSVALSDAIRGRRI